VRKAFFLVLVLAGFAAEAATPDGSEFTRMRLDYARAPGAILSWVVNDERKALIDCYPVDKKKFVEAGAKWLGKCPVDAKIQLMMGAAMSELGRPREAVGYRYQYYGLMRSIVGDSDGASVASAFRVISVDEEYSVCNFLGAEVKAQRLEGSCDVLSVLVGGEKKELYFDASIPLKAANDRLAK
jgi:hypothetical protein